MNNNLKSKINKYKEEDRLILECIAGSNLYNLNTPDSDLDIRGIFVNTIKEQNSLLPVTDEVSDDKSDIKYYSLYKFLKLTSEVNPNVIELLFIPNDKILYKNKDFDLIRKNKHLFISKKALHTFSGYAYSQIKRAKGLNKKANNIDKYVDYNTMAYHLTELEYDKSIKENIQRDYGKHYIQYLEKIKDTFDYKNYNININHIELKKRPQVKDYIWILDKKQDISINNPSSIITYNPDLTDYYDCSKIDHFKDLYKIFLNGTGIIKDNQIVVKSISKEREYNDFVGFFTFNQDAYEKDIKEWDSFFEWMCERNENRYNNEWKNEDCVDLKNLMHTVRLLISAENIAKNGEPLVTFKEDDKNRKFLMDIRQGKYKYDYLLKYAEDKIEELKVLFGNSSIPNKVNINKIDDLYFEIINKKEYKK